MYKLKSYSKEDGALIINESIMYRAYLLAGSDAEAVALVVGLNQQALQQQLAVHRFAFETAGIEVNGASIKTDRESQSLICNAFVSLTSDLVPDVDFKAVSDWLLIDKALIKPVARAVAAHSRGCFKGEKAVEKLIKAAATVADIEAIDIPSAFSVAYQSAYDEVMQPAGA